MMAWDLKERRYFDRVPIPSTANVFAADDLGNTLGRIRILGRGGFLLETNRRFPAGETLSMMMIAEREDIRRPVTVVPRYTSPDGCVGFEFLNLAPDATVELGVLIERYFQFSGDDR